MDDWKVAMDLAGYQSQFCARPATLGYWAQQGKFPMVMIMRVNWQAMDWAMSGVNGVQRWW